jgi:hypothetical protein
MTGRYVGVAFKKLFDLAAKKGEKSNVVSTIVGVEPKLTKDVIKRNEGSKKLFEISKGRKFNKGGRVGLKRGSFPDYSGDGKTTMKDILMGRGVIPKPKNKKKIMMAKKSKSPMDKTVRKA